MRRVVNTHCVYLQSRENSAGHRNGLMYVLIQHRPGVSSYCCYRGHVLIGSPEKALADARWIADMGDRVSLQEAQIHFPNMTEETYS